MMNHNGMEIGIIVALDEKNGIGREGGCFATSPMI